MKLLQFAILLYFQTISSQNLNEIKKYFLKEKEENTPYYLIDYKEAQRHKLKVINKINEENCIIYTHTELPKESQAKQLNNKWKLLQVKSCNVEKNYNIFTFDREETTQRLIKDKKTYKYKTRDCIEITCSYKYLTQLINSKEIYHVLEESNTITIESKIRDQNFTINNINKIKNNYPNLNGKETKIGLKDVNINPNDIDLLDKINFTSQGQNSAAHGTDMATIICGIGNSGIQGKGVANEASIQFSNTTDLYPENIDPTNLQTQNHSYGTVIEDFYGSLAQSFDEKIRDSQFITHIFSIGNEGTRGYKTATGNFKQAKNIITVGAIDQNETITTFSSKGPSYDGRIKPELVAYSETGTSNATALVSGISALLQEYYKTKNNQLLKNSTLKAILINAAKDLGNKGPDYIYGYGNVDAYSSLQTIIKNTILESNLTNKEFKTFQITIPQNTKKAKFTLVWDDIPANPGSALALINHISIKIKDANNNEYLPYVLDPNNPDKEAIQGIEDRNNIKQIEITNPESGNYTIELIGEEITGNNQNVSLVYSLENKDIFEWNYPIEKDNFPYDGRNFSPFKWNTNITNQTGNLSISFDEGVNWQTVNNSVDLKTGQYKHILNDKKCHIAKLKMTINNIEYISPSFIISYDLNLNTTLACNNTTEITWDQSTANNTYKVYELVNNKMEYKETINQNYYNYSGYNIHTVSPIVHGFDGIKSESTLQTEPDSKCYFESIRSEVLEENILITSSLFSILNITKIEVYKLEKNKTTLITRMDSNFEKSFTIKDINPNIGDNYYQIKITLNNGNTYESDIVNSFFTGENNFLIYPTIIRSEPLFINTKEEKNLPISISIYTISGQIIKNKIINSVNDNIDLNELSKGIYLYKIQSEKRKTQSVGKLIKL